MIVHHVPDDLDPSLVQRHFAKLTIARCGSNRELDLTEGRTVTTGSRGADCGSTSCADKTAPNAAVGGAVGAVTGLLTTPPPPSYHSYSRRQYGYSNHRHYANFNGRRQHTATAASTNAPAGY